MVKVGILNTRGRVQDPFIGELIVERSDLSINSIELQLTRIEIITGGIGDPSIKPIKESSEVQRIEIADGDIFRNVVIPIYMVFQRWFVCSTVDTSAFKIAFEVNLVIMFANNTVVIENIP